MRDSLSFCDACSRSRGDGGESDLKTLFFAPTMESMEKPNFDLLDETADEDCGDCKMEDMVSLAKVIVQIFQLEVSNNRHVFISHLSIV